MKINKENIKRALFPFIINTEIQEKLNKKWWHRLIVVLFSLIMIAGVFMVIFSPVIIFSTSDKDLNFLSSILIGLLLACTLYILLLIIQFIYFHILIYVIYGDNTNIGKNFKVMLKNIFLTISFLIFSGLVLFFAASNLCNKSSTRINNNPYRWPIMTFVCECNAGYKEDIHGCFKAKIPENAYECVNEKGWCCNSGYHMDGEKCTQFSYKKIKLIP